jgi:hypothetical protein
LKLDLAAARPAIAAIKTLDLRSASVEEIKTLLTAVFRGYQVVAPQFAPGIGLFRARICEKPANVRELSYPPPHVVGLGRVNQPGKPLLYCCTSRQAPFFEVRPPAATTLALVHWETTAPMLLNHVGYTSQAFRALGSARPHAGWSDVPAEIPAIDGNVEVAEFISDLFTRVVPRGEEHVYKLTVAVAEKLFAVDLFDGLLYPTVPMRANADNIALKPIYADTHLRFLGAAFVRIDAERDFAYDITVLDTAREVGTDGAIYWTGRRDQWVVRDGRSLTFTVQNGKWVALDAAGNIVEPS